MTKEVQDRVVQFVRKKAEENMASFLEVIWYGGEPLIGIDVIRDLTPRLKEIAEERHMEYYADIVTNGWFLDQEAADLLRAADVTAAQITLDGATAETHDATRFLKGGGGTFDRIISNLKTIRTDLKLNIRCNCHAGNIEEAQRLKDLVSSIAEETGNTMTFTPSFMDGELGNIDPCAAAGIGMDHEGFSRWVIDFESQETLPRYRFIGSSCMACNAHGYGIAANGDLYICWEHMGFDYLIVGNIDDYINDREPDARISVYDKYHEAVWPEHDEECMNCVVLPYCLGGCVYKRIENGMRQCKPIRYNLDQYVIQLSRQSKSSQKA